MPADLGLNLVAMASEPRDAVCARWWVHHRPKLLKFRALLLEKLLEATLVHLGSGFGSTDIRSCGHSVSAPPGLHLGSVKLS